MLYRYPDHLSGSFPTFADWLNARVRSLKLENFPLTEELKELHCPPSGIVMSYKAMWAFGCHYGCLGRGPNPYVSVDYGIASVTEDTNSLDVGILRDILLVTYGKLTCVVMRGEWMKSTDQGRASVRKDRLGFWSVQYESRDIECRHNPFVFPSQVSQVYIMNDDQHEEWKVVLYHEPRARRVTEDKDFPDIDSAGEQFPLPEGTGNSEDGPSRNSTSVDAGAVIIPAATVPAVVQETTVEEEDEFLDDADFEDEMELQYVE